MTIATEQKRVPNPGLTKDEEIKLLADFVASVPRNTYLIDFLDGAIENFEYTIRLDVCEPFARRTRESIRELDEARKAVQKQRVELKEIADKKAKLEREIECAKRELAKVRATAHRYAHDLLDL